MLFCILNFHMVAFIWAFAPQQPHYCGFFIAINFTYIVLIWIFFMTMILEENNGKRQDWKRKTKEEKRKPCKCNKFVCLLVFLFGLWPTPPNHWTWSITISLLAVVHFLKMTTIFIYLFIYFYHFLNFILKIKFENFGATFHHEFFSTHIENDWGSSINGLLEKTFNLVFVFFAVDWFYIW